MEEKTLERVKENLKYLWKLWDDIYNEFWEKFLNQKKWYENIFEYIAKCEKNKESWWIWDNRKWDINKQNIFKAIIEEHIKEKKCNFPWWIFPELDLSLLKFEWEVFFNNCIFEWNIIFDNWVFNSNVTFKNSKFKWITWFYKTIFKWEVLYDNSNFENIADLRSIFKWRTIFQNNLFKWKTTFVKSLFEMNVFFLNSIFESEVNFENSIFESEVDFKNNIFKWNISFRDSELKDVIFNKTIFEWKTVFNNSFLDIDFYSNAFKWDIYFEESIFKWYVDFSHSIFEWYVDFSHSIFEWKTNLWTHFKDEIILPEKIGENISFNWAIFEKDLNLSNKIFEWDIDFSNSIFRWELNLLDISPDKDINLDLNNTKFEKVFNFSTKNNNDYYKTNLKIKWSNIEQYLKADEWIKNCKIEENLKKDKKDSDYYSNKISAFRKLRTAFIRAENVETADYFKYKLEKNITQKYKFEKKFSKYILHKTLFEFCFWYWIKIKNIFISWFIIILLFWFWIKMIDNSIDNPYFNPKFEVWWIFELQENKSYEKAYNIICEKENTEDNPICNLKKISDYKYWNVFILSSIAPFSYISLQWFFWILPWYWDEITPLWSWLDIALTLESIIWLIWITFFTAIIWKKYLGT